MSFARAAWPWALAVTLTAVFMVALGSLVLPTPPRVDATAHPMLQVSPDVPATLGRGSPRWPAEVPGRAAVRPHDGATGRTAAAAL